MNSSELIEKIKKDEIKRKIYEGIKDMNEGKVIDGEECFAILSKKYGKEFKK